MSNDVEALLQFFWNSSDALRFGVNESLYGASRSRSFAGTGPPVDLSREVSNLKIVAFGEDCAIVTLEFDRSIQGTPRHGRQSQVWRKFPEGWKIVSAHVSLVPPSYMDLAAALTGLPIPAPYREGVRRNIERTAAIARPLLEMNLDDSLEAAPVFIP